MKSISFGKVVLVALWAASLLLVAQWGKSQTPPSQKSLPALGTIISGDDIGYRFQGFSNNAGASGAVKGQWMVKIGGSWMSVQAPGVAVKPLTEH